MHYSGGMFEALKYHLSIEGGAVRLVENVGYIAQGQRHDIRLDVQWG